MGAREEKGEVLTFLGLCGKKKPGGARGGESTKGRGESGPENL